MQNMENNSKLYTRIGDKGYTKTLSNFRVSKADSIIELLGTLDEFVSSLSLAKTFVTDSVLAEDITRVQKKIVDISKEVEGGKQSVTRECVSVLEDMIDLYSDKAGDYEYNVYVATSRASAALDTARAIIRRAERTAVKAGQFGRLRPELMAYLNRLSDLVFIFARCADNKNAQANAEAIKIDSNIVSQHADMLTLSMAKQLSEEIEKQGKAMGLNIVVAIADSGANLMLLHSMDDAYIASSKIAQDKAYTSVALKMPTITALELSRGGALDGLSYTSENRIILLGGGEPLKINGRIVGGLGVSGGTAEEDTALARFGAELFSRLYS